MHMNDFKHYLVPPEGKAIPCLYFQPRGQLPESDDYVVEKILDHKVEKGRHLWILRLKGYGPEEETWEPASSFMGHIQKDWKQLNKDQNLVLNLQNL